MTRDFEIEWREVRLQVLAFCRRLTGDPDLAQDVFQEVAIRAWRGYPSFRRNSKFLTWVLQIAKREITRVMSKPGGKEVSLEHEPVALPTSVPEAIHLPGSYWVVEATQAALTGGELTEREGKIIFARLAQPEASWSQLGATLGLSGTTCAVTHCRAIPKLRAFLFVHRLDLLGGRECVAQAFTRALAGGHGSRLTAAETAVFRRMVLEGQTSYHPAGWRQTLRASCDRVIKELPLP